MVVTETREYDILIIGGGVIGIFCAYYASQAWPHKKIAIMDKGMLGKGVTAYSACLDFPYGVTAYKRKLTGKSQGLFSELMEKYPELPVARVPFVGIAHQRSIGEVLSNITAPGAQKGMVASFHQHVPAGFQLGEGNKYFHQLHAQYAYNDITYALALELAREQKITIYEGTEATSLDKPADKYVVATNYGVSLKAGAIIDATGPWMNKGFSAASIAYRQTRIKKIVALHIDEAPPANAPIIYLFNDDAFFLPQPHLSRWLFSYRCEDWDLDIYKDDFKISPANYSDASNVLRKYNEGLHSRIAGGRAYCDLYSPDGDPIIETPDTGYVIVGAPGGSGFRLAPALAQSAISTLT